MHISNTKVVTISNYLAAFALLFYCLAIFVQYLGWDLEDSYIIYRIVENLTVGNGWRFNLDQIHNASTSVLNTVILWLISEVVIRVSDLTPNTVIPYVAHATGSLFIFISSLLFLLRYRDRIFLAPLGALVIAHFSAQNASWGLECHLFLMLFLMFITLERKQKGSWPVLGFLVLARPDGAIALGCKGIVSAIKNFRGAIVGTLTVGLVLAPWVYFSLGEFNQIFPATLSNKIWQGNSGLWGEGMVYLRDLALHLKNSPTIFKIAIPLAVINTAVLILRRDPLLYLVLFATLQQVAYIIMNVPGYHWYFSILDLAIVITALDGALKATSSMSEILKGRVIAQTFIGAAIVPVSAILTMQSLSSPQSDSGNRHYLAASAKINQLSETGTLATVEVGTLGYLTKRRILDLTGLTTPNPELLSGKNNDLFFKLAPELVLFHEPIWHFEKAIFLDPRFDLMYGDGELLDGPVGLRIFKRSRPAGEISNEEISKHLRSKLLGITEIPPFDYAKLVERNDYCVVDLVNGSLFRERKIVAPKSKITLSGWAIDRESSSLSDNISVILESRTTERRTFKLPTQRQNRPDIAQHFARANWERSGYTAQAHLLDIPTGTYRISILQTRASVGDDTLVWCEPGKNITVE